MAANDFNLNYTAPRVAAQFIKDTARFKAIKGPIGCLPSDSEFLTPQGWKRMDEYVEGDEVAVWEPDTDSVSYEQVEYVVEQSEHFIRFEAPDFVMELSPEHRIAFRHAEVGVTEVPAAVLEHCPDLVKVSQIIKPSDWSEVSGTDLTVSRVDKGDRKYCFHTRTGYFVARCEDTVFITHNSGKSVACVMNILKNCMEIPPFEDGIRRSRWVVVRNTLSQLQDTTIKTFFEWVKPGVLGKWHESKKVFNLKFGDVEAEILFRPLDSPDDVQRVLSLEITGAWVNECRSVPVSLISDLQGRCGRYPRKADVPEYWSGVIADTNPPDEDTDWWRVFEQLPLEEGNESSVLRGGIYHQPSGMSSDADNVENLIDGYYENLSQGRPHAWVDVYVNGNYGTSQQGLPIYRQSFRRDKHVIAGIEPDLTLPVVIGMDFGRTPAALYMQLNRSGRLQAFKESVSFGIGMDTFIAEHVRPTLLNHFPGCPVVVIGDPSGVKQNDTDNNTCFKVLKAAGFDAKPAKTNAPDVRINTIENALLKYPHGDPYFQIHPDCKWFIQGLHTKYMYRKIRSKPGQVEDKPSKNDWSHIVEAGQYGVLFVESGHYSKYDFERQYENDPFNFTTQSSSVACSYAGY